MTFLAPTLLLLGLAAAVPVVLHLIQRHPGPRLDFPPLRYLRRAERERATRVRLRQILLLALRVLALVLLATAAARPFIQAGGRDHRPTALVFVLDNSMASGAIQGDERVLDRYVRAALDVVARAGPEDRLWLIRAGEPWEPALSGDAEVLAETIEATEPVASVADLRGQVERALSILATEAGERVREVHVLSPLTVSTVRPDPAAPSGSEPEDGATSGESPPVRVLILDLDAEPLSNRAITGVEVGGGIAPLAGERAPVTASILAIGDGQPVDVRLVVDGQTRSAATAEPGSTVTLWLPAGQPGLVTGRVEMDPDMLGADDRRYFVTEARAPATVRLVARTPFVEEALAVLEDAGRTRRDQAGRADVVVAPGAVGLDALRDGSAVLVLPPDSPLELAAVNRRLSEAGIPWRLQPPLPGGDRLALDGTDLAPLLEDARLHQVYGLEPVGEATDSVVLRLRGGEPWAVTGRTEAGAYLLLATPLTAEGGTIPTSHAMLPLLDRAINGWLREAVAHREYHPGDVVVLPGADSVARPGGRAERLGPAGSYRLAEPGIYRFYTGEELTTALAVNPPAAASDLRRGTPADLAALVPGHDVRAVSARGWDAAVFHQRMGQEITLILLLAAIVALAAESALASAGRGPARGKPAGDSSVRGPTAAGESA